MVAVVLAPHQDDEVLGAYLLMSQLKRNGTDVKVVFVTNGDYEGTAIAATRSRESIAALKRIGICEDSAFFLGYADTGMPYPESFLLRLYHNSDGNEILPSRNSKSTYAAGGYQTFHSLKTGAEANYSRRNFKADLADILKQLDPGILILPSIYDYHGDHRAVGLFWKEIQKEAMPLRPKVHAYLLHGGDDLLWPARDTPRFDCPPCIPPEVWSRRKLFHYNQELCKDKKAALETFTSQKPLDYNRYLLAFAKQEEFFLDE